MIEINNLVKKYGDHVAVDDLSLTVEPGKIYGFLGPNGAGKSTTMNIITGYIGATSGTVKVNGHDIFAEPEEAKKCVGYLPEIPPLYVDMTVREYLDFVAELKKLEKSLRKRYVEEAMETTGTTEVEKRLIRNLSKGYRQRVGFAQAVLGYPEIIILDEPTVGLDPAQIIEIRDLIKRLGEKHTVILSSHILSEISAVCDHVFIISKGKLVASDSTDNLVNLMSGEQEISLTVRGDAERAKALLNEIPEVERVELHRPAQEKANALPDLDAADQPPVRADEAKLVVHAKKGTDIREQVFFKLCDERIPVLEMRTAAKSLEDVFIELTQEGGDQ